MSCRTIRNDFVDDLDAVRRSIAIITIMKFGATLARRSVPQWRTHNLDYDEIKNLIKQQTSSQEGCTREFEKNLLTVLDSELERVKSHLHSGG